MCKPLSNIRRPRRSPIKSAKYTRIQRSLRNDGINYTVTKATKRKVESASPVDSLVRQTVCRVTECKPYQLPDNSRENRAPKSLTRSSGGGEEKKKREKGFNTGPPRQNAENRMTRDTYDKMTRSISLLAATWSTPVST